MKILLPFFAWALCAPALASEGFQPSAERPVVMLKGATQGATAFFMQVPAFGNLLVTQKQVADSGDTLTIQWGNAVALFFRLRVVDAGAFQYAFQAKKIWENESQDIAVLQTPLPAWDYCHCRALEAGEFRAGPARLVGYPIIKRRTYPRPNSWWSRLGEVWGEVTQQASEGRVWEANGEYLGDMDALPGNAGGPVLNAEGKVIGIFHSLKSSPDEGYPYRNPSLSFLPIQAVLEGLKGVPKSK